MHRCSGSIRAWYQEHGAGSENGTTAGRSFYTSLGHLNETWQVRSSYGLGLNLLVFQLEF
jgi:hypothetical protein